MIRIAGKIRNAKSLNPGITTARLTPYQEPNKQLTGHQANSSRISRVGTTARKTGSGSAGR